MKRIGVLGAGGMAREAASYSPYVVDFFAVNKEYVDPLDNRLIDITSPSDEQMVTPVVSALGAPALRMTMLEMWPGNNYGTVIASSAQAFSRKFGRGVIVAPNSIVTTDVEVGDHTIINIGATVSHNCKLGEFVTISPGAHIAGGVELGDGVFVGIGATVSNDIKVASGVVIGAGAVVVHDIMDQNAVVVGVPARVIKINKGWMSEV